MKISDRPTTGPRLVQFYTFYVSVIAPAPEYEQVSINPVTRTVTLQWKDHACENVEAFQVWRRISKFPYQQPECDFGMPEFLRYQLLSEQPASSHTYTDHDLAYGAQYCYRVVALVGNKRTPGRLSIDTCFIPKPAEAPVITNVSVETTDEDNGQILVRWTSPFDIDPQQYPPPYAYKVFRKNESAAMSTFEAVTNEPVGDTVFTDKQLNTKDNLYSYRVELYVPSLTEAPVDTSSQASSVFASAQPLLNAIGISWMAKTPWYNFSFDHPYHLIYKSNDPAGPFELIDSVDVNKNGFHYIDRGQGNNGGLQGSVYYYKVKTRGEYGNDQIPSPLENYSQIVAGQTLDTIPPCAPDLSIAQVDCADFACNASDYYTKLQWQPSPDGCDDDVVAYDVLIQSDSTNVFTPLATVKETFFLHTDLTSLNHCYRLVAIDRAGNRSDTSAITCSSSCLAFSLPNVITPGASDEKNDYLTTYPDDDVFRDDCPRSVQQVDIAIYSRWGDEIFTNTLGGDQSAIFWDGRTSGGTEAASGVYFYHATVIFDTNDASRKKQEFKGWVQLIR